MFPSTQRKDARMALVALACGAAAIAFAPIFVRLTEVGLTATAFWRIALSLPAFRLWLAIEGRRNERSSTSSANDNLKSSAPGAWVLILPGLFFAGDLAIWHQAIGLTTVANATLFANCAPIFVTLAAWALFKQRITRLFIVGMMTALVGAAVVMRTSLHIGSHYVLGDALGITTSLFYSSYILTVKELRGRFSTPRIMFTAGIACSAALLVVTLLTGEKIFATSLRGWLVLVGLALISHVGGQGLIAFALAYLPATFSSVTLLLQPVLATVFAWMILSEVLGPLQVLGGAVVLCGIFLARQGSRMSAKTVN